MLKPLPTFKNLLVATDFSDSAKSALDAGRWMAQQFHARLKLAHVVRDVFESMAVMGYGVGWEPTIDELTSLQKQLRHDAEERLLALSRAGEAAEIEVQTEVLSGTPFVEIVRAVEAEGIDLVVAGTRGLSTFKRVLIGSTATKLARLCPCPVWIARSEHPEGLKSILVPLDFSAASERALSHAALLAKTTGAELHLLHVYDTDDLHGLLPLSEETKAELAQWRRRARRAALDRLQHSLEAISDEHGLTAAIHVIQGTPWKVICATAKRLSADLIVVGSVGRSGIPGLVVGNTAERVLHHCESSLLVVKPATISVMQPATTEQAAAPEPAASFAAP